MTRLFSLRSLRPERSGRDKLEKIGGRMDLLKHYLFWCGAFSHATAIRVHSFTRMMNFLPWMPENQA